MYWQNVTLAPYLALLIGFNVLAEENVKKCWVEQDIWNDKWESEAHMVRWKHEQLLEVESESSSESEEGEDSPPLIAFPKKEAQRESSPEKTDEEVRRIKERRAARVRKREASRPFHQFMYQMLKEGERLRDESRRDGTSFPDAADINTKSPGFKPVHFETALVSPGIALHV
ncbi:hypothetical protein F5B20DRAFT_576293 [Whalleya microplaca]|nr:hypothetical protein F5B20DRAFT_576293 [Whalleya microplaca]